MTDRSYAIRTITAKLKIGALLGFIALGVLSCPCALALDPSLDITQYAHTAWTVRDGFSLGNIYAITQTPDGYLCAGYRTEVWFASMASAVFSGNRLRVSISLTGPCTGYSRRATALFG